MIFMIFHKLVQGCSRLFIQIVFAYGEDMMLVYFIEISCCGGRFL